MSRVTLRLVTDDRSEAPVRYISTRGGAPALAFDDVLLTGLARDGGLYLPETWPHRTAEDWAALADRDYAGLAAGTMAPFVGDTLSEGELADLVARAYATFDHAAVAPLVQLDREQWLMELFHGPTIAFKDYALQLVGQLFDHVLAKHGQRITVIGATSGDTGSAGIEAVRDRDQADIFMLHPHGRVSDVQRRQMTTVASANVFNIAVEGSFDDCQDLVKAMFNDAAFRDRLQLSAVNSINWARILGQIVYYVWAWLAVGGPDRPVSFAVPSGNFGNVFAAYAAKKMGLPVGRLIVGANRNDILHRFFQTGRMDIEGVVPTISPSMDIQISSNFERLLFDLDGRDGPALARRMDAFRKTGRMEVTPAQLAEARSNFDSFRLDDEGIRATIRAVRAETGQTIDPHTAVGVAAARALKPDIAGPVVSLACAHPAKFPDAVEAATGVRPPLPEKLGDLFDRPERMVVLPNDLAQVQAYIAGNARLLESVT